MTTRSSFHLILTTFAVVALLGMVVPRTRAVTDDQLKIACKDMTPRHTGYDSENFQSVPCPYRLVVNTMPVVPGELVNVTLTSLNGSTPFKGFMIQARDPYGNILGTFLPDCVNGGNKSHHMISCSNGLEPYNAAVQSNNKFKVSETFTWVAPTTLSGPFKFKFTVVLDYEHFWINEETDNVPVVQLSPKEYKLKSSVNHEYYVYKLFECLSSSRFTNAERLSFENLVEFYLPPFENDNSFVELKIWKMKIVSQDVNIKSGLEALLSCPKNDLPNVYFLIKLFWTLPGSTATTERSFS